MAADIDEKMGLNFLSVVGLWSYRAAHSHSVINRKCTPRKIPRDKKTGKIQSTLKWFRKKNVMYIFFEKKEKT